MKHLLLKIALWLARLAGVFLFPAPAELTKVIAAATLETAHWMDKEGVSGEYKRHQVYAKLRKQFPEADGRSIGLAIELSLYF